MNHNVDFLIVGAGVVGLALAREIKIRRPDATIAILEKESRVGLHASGRNSGVMHSGIYYPEDSLKAKVCAEGALAMAEYCQIKGLPFARFGKVVLPVKVDDDPQLELLARRATANGAEAELIDDQQLREIEPDAYTVTGRALHVPETSVIDPMAVMECLAQELTAQGVQILYNSEAVDLLPGTSCLDTRGDRFSYGCLINSAGLHADQIASRLGVGCDYTILPFKGIYYRLSPESGIKVNGLIYPVPDLSVPFLGVHFTRKVTGEIYLGPTAIPALGRENYHGMSGVNVSDAISIMKHLSRQYLKNKQNFRKLVHQEGTRMFRSRFAEAARVLVPKTHANHLLASDKIGIRAQLLNTRTSRLEMDFVVETGENSVHILNAVSPAFTSSFSFARHVVENFVKL